MDLGWAVTTQHSSGFAPSAFQLRIVSPLELSIFSVTVCFLSKENSLGLLIASSKNALWLFSLKRRFRHKEKAVSDEMQGQSCGRPQKWGAS